MPFMLYVFDTIAESDMNESQKELLIYAIASNYVAIQEGCQTQPALNHYIPKMPTYNLLCDIHEEREVPNAEYKEYEREKTCSNFKAGCFPFIKNSPQNDLIYESIL